MRGHSSLCHAGSGSVPDGFLPDDAFRLLLAASSRQLKRETESRLVLASRVLGAPVSAPHWSHIDDVREEYGFTFGEALLAALSSNWARLDAASGNLGVFVSDRGQFRTLKRWTMQLAGSQFVPSGCEDAEITASWHTLSLSNMVEACGRGWAPEIAAIASRKVWFRERDALSWQPPNFEVCQVSDYASRESDYAG